MCAVVNRMIRLSSAGYPSYFSFLSSIGSLQLYPSFQDLIAKRFNSLFQMKKIKQKN